MACTKVDLPAPGEPEINIPSALVLILSSSLSVRLYSFKLILATGFTAVISKPSANGGYAMDILYSLDWTTNEPSRSDSKYVFESDFALSSISSTIFLSSEYE